MATYKGKKIYKTSNGQPYIKDKDGRPRFIKRSSTKKASRKKSLSAKPKKRASRSVKSMAKKKKSYKRKSSKVSIEKALLGGVAVTLAEPMLDNLASKIGLNISDDIVKLGVGIYGSNKFNGAIGEGAKALAYIAGARVMSGLNIGNLFGSSSSTSTSSQSDDGEMIG